MPAAGDQHNNAPVNPFEEVQPRISEYTAQQIATLQARLQRQLGPEYISTRKGPGGKNVHYIASEKVIGLANEVFGFNGWSSTIRDIQVDFVDENVQTHKIDIGLSVIVRVTLQDGTFHEDIGYGHMENCSGKAAAFEKAKKEGTTDALKRALRNFGNVLGNCVYDKEYLSKVTKIKAKPTVFSEDNLHRHADFVSRTAQPEPAKPALNDGQNMVPNPAVAAVQVAEAANGSHPSSRRSSVHMETEDDFGSADFDVTDFSFAELDHPDEMAVDQPRPAPGGPRNMQAQQGQSGPPRPNGQRTNLRTASVPPQKNAASRPQNNGPMQPAANVRQPGVHAPQSRPNGAPAQAVPAGQAGTSRPTPQIQPNAIRAGNPQMQAPRPAPQQPQPPNQQPPAQPFEQAIPAGAPTGFVSAKAAEPVQTGANMPAQLPSFNPRAESPSIRKTAGVDHTKSMGIKRAHVLGPEPAPPGRPVQTDMGRRLGAPQTMPSPLANRGQFKPVGIVNKRPAEGAAVQQQQQVRAVLNDVTSTSINAPVTVTSGPDPKRPRLDIEQNTGPGANGA